LDIRDVTFSLSGNTILKDVNITIQQGDFVAVIGPNGSGKTTFLKLILGLYRPDKGTIRVLGQEPNRACSHIGYMPQHPTGDRIFPARVIDVVLSGLIAGNGLLPSLVRVIGPSCNNQDKRKALECLELMGIRGLAKKNVGNLSGGQLQRVLLARALVSNPKILLLDEPMANIDMGTRGILFDLLADLNRSMTILMVTHDIGLISRHIKSVLCIGPQVFFHEAAELTMDMTQALGLQGETCHMELLGHGIPHRVLGRHNEMSEKRGKMIKNRRSDQQESKG